MPMPDFVVAGAPRCGTTSLHHYLGQHPRISMSAIKEPNHFLFDGPDRTPLVDEPSIITKSVPDRAAYEALFDPSPGMVRGEASPLYLYVPRTPELLASELDHPKAIAVLRHPVERAWSHFLYTYTGAAEEAEARFAADVDRELSLGYTPFRTGTHVIRLGHYGEQLRRYSDILGQDSLWVGTYDDLGADAPSFVDSIVRFLGLEPCPLDTSVVHNAALLPGGRVVQASRAAMARVQPMAKKVLPRPVTVRLAAWRTRRTRDEPVPELSAGLRARLVEHYAPTTDAVEGFIGRDLPAWRS